MFRKAICLAVLAATMMVSGVGNAQESRTIQNASSAEGAKVVATATSLRTLYRYIGGPRDTLHASCIEKGQTCTLHGTPCCDPYDCKGSFPNTTCK